MNPFEIAGADLVPVAPKISDHVEKGGLSMPNSNSSPVPNEPHLTATPFGINMHPISTDPVAPSGPATGLTSPSGGFSIPAPVATPLPDSGPSAGLSFPSPTPSASGPTTPVPQGLAFPTSTVPSMGLSFPSMSLGPPMQGPSPDPHKHDPMTTSLLQGLSVPGTPTGASVTPPSNSGMGLGMPQNMTMGVPVGSPVMTPPTGNGNGSGFSGVPTQALRTSGVGMAPPSTAATTAPAAPGVIPGIELRTFGLGDFAVLHDRLLSHLLQKLLPEYVR